MRGAAPCLLMLTGTVLGCFGLIDGADPGHPAPAPPGPEPSSGPAAEPRSPLDRPGPMPLLRLNREELGNTLRDLLGHDAADARVLPPDSRGVHGFFDPGPISTVEADHLLDLADRVGASFVKKLPSLAGCDPAATGEQACVRQLVTGFGRRAWRRPLTGAEIGELVDYFGQVKATLGYGFADAARVLVQAMLLAPGFLYHWELGPQPASAAGGLVKLNPHEAAARLSYFLWGSMPDDALFAAVDGGRFTTEADVEREARRLLASPKARATVASFHGQWLALDRLAERQKDPKAYPQWTSDLARALADDVAAFTARTILEGDGKLRTLLTAPASYTDATLAKLYGADPKPRGGLFTHPSFLTVHASASGSHPVKRGHKIYEDVLCGEIPSPPDDVPPAGTPSPTSSTRELFAEHGRNACAAACHGLMDPLGFAFESYDAIGRYRATDGGKPVDASGVLTPPAGGPPRPFSDAVDFVNALASLEDARRCFARQWFRFLIGRREIAGDEASFEAAYGAFAASGHNIRELLVRLATVRSFLYRAPADGEVLR